MNIKIISDSGEVYKNGQIISLDDLKRDFEEANWDADPTDENAIPWDGWAKETILNFICDAWGIQYEVLK